MKEDLILKGLGVSLINKEIKSLDELLNIINDLNNKPVNIFEKLKINDPELISFINNNFLNLKEEKDDKYPDDIFYYNDKKLHILAYNIKTNRLQVYSETMKELNHFNYNNVQKHFLIKDIIEEVYKLKIGEIRTGLI